MVDTKTGSVLIEKDGEYVGILTKGDLSQRVIAKFKKPIAVQAASIMSQPIISIESNQLMATAFLTMGKYRIRQIGPNDIFGELDLIDHRPRAATITANQDSSVTELFKDEKTEAIVRDNPRALLVIVKVLANSLRNIIKNAQGIGY